ncbi:MAG: type II toxin-antitoxin system VapC family toxin [Pyrinomonadaceae bacterium]
MRAPLLTCEAVIAEAGFLTQRMLGSSKAVYDFVETGAVKIDFNVSQEFEGVKDLAIRYQNVPMSLADACLVRMSEIHENSTVFTTDSDFLIYRKNGNQIIPTILP